MAVKKIKVDYLARVEGEGALHVTLKDGAVRDVELRIFEPPRFFEAFLRGRAFGEAPDITARICGICPVAYQMSAVHAMEDAFGVAVDAPLRALRRPPGPRVRRRAAADRAALVQQRRRARVSGEGSLSRR